MVELEKIIKKYSIILDAVILILCSFLVISSLEKNVKLNAEYSFINPDIICNVLLILAAIKLYACLNINNKKAISATVLLFAAIIARQIGLADFTYLIIPMVALYGVDFQVVAKVFSSSTVFGLLIALFLALTGIVPNIATEREGSVQGYAYMLGFNHHSWFMMYLLFAEFAILYLFRKNRFRVLIFMAIQLISVILWLVTDSNTCGIIIILTCVVMIIDYLINTAVRSYSPSMRRLQKALLKFSVLMPVVAVVITILGCVYFGYFGFRIFPHNMLSRFYTIDSALEALGVPLPFSVTDERFDITYNLFKGAGQEIYVDGDYILDNLYGKLFVENGLLVFVAYLALQMNVRYKLYKGRQYVLGLICTVISLFGLFETRAFTTIACALFSMLLFTRFPVKKVRKKSKSKRLR